MPWKKIKFSKKPKVSTQFRIVENKTNCVQKLPEDELAVVSATKDYTSVEDRVMETDSKAVREFSHVLQTL